LAAASVLGELARSTLLQVLLKQPDWWVHNTVLLCCDLTVCCDYAACLQHTPAGVEAPPKLNPPPVEAPNAPANNQVVIPKVHLLDHSSDI
jgi:hypothetical protein